MSFTDTWTAAAKLVRNMSAFRRPREGTADGSGTRWRHLGGTQDPKKRNRGWRCLHGPAIGMELFEI